MYNEMPCFFIVDCPPIPLKTQRERERERERERDRRD